MSTPTRDPSPAYVALGDSYSTGLGTGSYLAGTGTCQRSALSYPALVAAAYGLDLDLRASPGASIADVAAVQLDALGPETTHVTVTAGGNDAGFGLVLTECALPAWASDGEAAVDGAQRYVTTRLRTDLAALYTLIGERAPGARVVAVGYPRIFAREDCNLLTWFSPDELLRLDETADLMNAEIAAAADDTGCLVADPTEAFLGHAVCQDEWVNGLSVPIEESYHPNRLGHALGYAPLVGPLLTGLPVPARAALARESVEASLVERQAAWAAVDATILPRPFQAPDLHSPRVLLAARRAGVDVDDPASVAAADAAATRVRGARRGVLGRPDGP